MANNTSELIPKQGKRGLAYANRAKDKFIVEECNRGNDKRSLKCIKLNWKEVHLTFLTLATSTLEGCLTQPSQGAVSHSCLEQLPRDRRTAALYVNRKNTQKFNNSIRRAAHECMKDRCRASNSANSKVQTLMSNG